ncbi:MAG: fructose-1,6-bisphosphatase [Treponema sp.]|nr:fructose-1,6-bisphosphatase [Treponema sp.]
MCVTEENKNLLRVLSRQYPTQRSVITEIANLQAILALPKGTEHFLTDVHGNYEQFNHVLKNGSGSIRQKIEEIFGDTEMPSVKRSLATLIYYPREKIEIVKATETDMPAWYATTIHRLVAVTRRVSSKYTRSKVRKAIPDGFSYIIEELITEKEEINDKQAYYNAIIKTIIRIGAADSLIEAMCQLIQQLVIDHLHIIGDIYDRGPGPHYIMDMLMDYHSVDIQWGNHDIIWMAAASGHKASIANVVRMCAKYNTLDVLNEGYGINLTPLVTFALQVYGSLERSVLHKAMGIIQYKLEGMIIKENPEFLMDDRLLLDKINWDQGTVHIGDQDYALSDSDFPTIDRHNPYELTDEEAVVINRLQMSFLHCEKLQRHVRFLFAKGHIYTIYNDNLLYHGCVPLMADGSFAKVSIYGKEYSGRALFDILEEWARRGYFSKWDSDERKKGQNILWYLWEGPWSPVFGKDKMATFERQFVIDKVTHREKKNAYYAFVDDESVVNRILEEFGLQPSSSHIINGHVPQEIKNGATPIKCGGKLLIIDGGFSAAYHEKTGIAGYTLVSNSRGMRLVVHEKFESTEKAIINETDIVSDTQTVEVFAKRKYVADTENGKRILIQIQELEQLLAAYQDGFFSEETQ